MTLQEFIEVYNQNIDWNKDIIMSIKPKIRENDCVKTIISSYLSTRKISNETCDLNGNFEIFDYGDNRKELQIYSRVSHCNISYLINPKLDEKAYKTEKVNFLIANISGYRDNIDEIILDLENKKNVLKELENDICYSIIEKQIKLER